MKEKIAQIQILNRIADELLKEIEPLIKERAVIYYNAYQSRFGDFECLPISVESIDGCVICHDHVTCEWSYAFPGETFRREIRFPVSYLYDDRALNQYIALSVSVHRQQKEKAAEQSRQQDLYQLEALKKKLGIS